MQHNMIVIGHHRIDTDIQGENTGQGLYSVFDPLPTVFVVMTGKWIDTAEKASAHTA